MNSTFYQIKNSQAADFIERLAKKLEIDKKYIDISKDVCNNIHKLDIASTHEPPSVAAGCILLVANTYNLNITKKQISEIFDISDVTISKTYRKIYPYYKIILNNKVTELVIQKKMENSMVNPDKNEISESNLVLREQLKKELLEDIEESSENSDDSNDDSEEDELNESEVEAEKLKIELEKLKIEPVIKKAKPVIDKKKNTKKKELVI